MFTLLLALLAFGPMLAEAARSSSNERALRAADAVEPAGDVFAAMRIVYPGCFLAMLAESWLRPRGTAAIGVAGVIVFCAAKLLKYWAIATLGSRWTFRVLVPRGSQRTLAGPYRFMRHPNYLAIAGEIGGFALAAGALWTGAASLAVFGALLRARIRVEETALGLRVR
jgi:methyltransferase